MATVILSSKYQVVIPKEIREQLKLKRGQKIIVVAKEGLINLIPERPLTEMRGILKGMDTTAIREEGERV